MAISVLTRPFDEVALALPYASPPDAAYFGGLLGDLAAVEAEVEGQDPGMIRLVHGRGELEQALEARYREDAELIASENVLRVLRQLWPA